MHVDDQSVLPLVCAKETSLSGWTAAGEGVSDGETLKRLIWASSLRRGRDKRKENKSYTELLGGFPSHPAGGVNGEILCSKLLWAWRPGSCLASSGRGAWGEDKSSLEKYQRLLMPSLFSTLSFLHLYPLPFFCFFFSLSVSLFLCACLRVFVWLPHIPGVHDR